MVLDPSLNPPFEGEDFRISYGVTHLHFQYCRNPRTPLRFRFIPLGYAPHVALWCSRQWSLEGEDLGLMDLLALQRVQDGDEAVVPVLISDVAAGDQTVWLDSFGFLASVCTGLTFTHRFFGFSFCTDPLLPALTPCRNFSL